LSKSQGYALLVITAACWSLNGVIIKLADMSALNIAFYRSSIAALFLMPFALRRREPLNRGSLEIAGAYAGTVILLVLATKATTAANAIFLHYTAPLFVFLIGIPLLGERPSGRDWKGLGLAMVGVLCIVLGGGEADRLGVGFGLASGLSFGTLIVLLRRYRARNPLWIAFGNNLVVGLLLLPWIGGEIWISSRDLLLMLVMGIVQLGLPYVLFGLAIRQVNAREASLISLLEPLLNPVWVFFLVGEIPSWETRLGGGIIFTGLLLRFGVGMKRRRG
jgi:drug/metabolite transporter, DME family